MILFYGSIFNPVYCSLLAMSSTQIHCAYRNCLRTNACLTEEYLCNVRKPWQSIEILRYLCTVNLLEFPEVLPFVYISS